MPVDRKGKWQPRKFYPLMPFGAFRAAKGGEYQRAEGYVWCLYHGIAHEPSNRDPFGEGWRDRCKAADHRTLYFRSRRGDTVPAGNATPTLVVSPGGWAHGRNRSPR